MNQAATLDGPNVTTLIHSDALPWDTSKSTQKRFRTLTFQVLGGGLVALLLINEVIKIFMQHVGKSFCKKFKMFVFVFSEIRCSQ